MCQHGLKVEKASGGGINTNIMVVIVYDCTNMGNGRYG